MLAIANVAKFLLFVDLKAASFAHFNACGIEKGQQKNNKVLI